MRYSTTLFAVQVALLAALIHAPTITTHAQTITNIEVTNSSSSNLATSVREFETESFLSPVSTLGLTRSFSHRLAAFNKLVATGTVAQTNKRSVAYQLDFTVEDPANVGFELSLESIIRGVSTVTQTFSANESLTAVATGLTFDMRIDDSTDAPDTFKLLPAPLFGQGSGSVSVTGIGSDSIFDESIAQASLGNFVGTTSFNLRITSATTPTTNVIFQNNHRGEGEVIYGLGTLPSQYEHLNLDDLGHLTTVSVTFVPEPSTATFFALGMIMACHAVLARGSGRG